MQRTVPVHRITLQPGNHEQPDDHYSYGWIACHSPRTPRHSLNGDPDARYLGEGDHFYIVKGIASVSPLGRMLNFHNVALDPGWNGVSPLALDSWGNPSVSGSDTEWVCEYERIQDVDREPHSGGAHWPMPPGFFQANMATMIHWIGVEVIMSGQEQGRLRCYDWLTGTPLVAIDGINTLEPGSHLAQLWEGGYQSGGVSSPAVGYLTSALFSATSFADALTDQPVVVDAWTSSGPTSSSIALNYSSATIPDSPLTGAPTPPPGPTVSDVLDEAIAELHSTTVGMVNTHWKIPPAGSHWANGLAKIRQAQKL